MIKRQPTENNNMRLLILAGVVFALFYFGVSLSVHRSTICAGVSNHSACVTGSAE
jgi:hypothetical protein